MALLFCDSFDHYVSADIDDKWVNYVSAPATIVAAAGRRASASLRTATSSYVYKGIPPVSTVVVGLALKATVLNTVQFLHLAEPASDHLVMRLNVDGSVSVCRMNNVPPSAPASVAAVLGTTLPGLVPASAFVYYELKVTIHDTAGTVELRLNGSATPALNLTSQDTRNGGTGVVSVIYLGPATVSGTYDFDDFYVLDTTGPAPCNDVLGDVRIDVRYPTAEGTSSQWTPSAGTDNALMLDEVAPNDDTDYTSTSTVGQKDTFVVADAPVVGAAVLGVQVNISAKKSDAGVCGIAPVVRHGTTDYPGTAQNPGTTYSYLVQPYSLNPGTGAAWTEAGFNAAEFGYIRTA